MAFASDLPKLQIAPAAPLPSSFSTSAYAQRCLPGNPKSDAARFGALQSRSPRYSTSFIYAVTTTRIYCRPTCPARLARRANIVFFDQPAQAEAKGFRACKRCRPDRRPRAGGDAGVEDEAAAAGGDGVGIGDGAEGRRKVGRAVELIREKAERGEKVVLGEVAAEVGMSKWHFLRLFRRVVGVSPREFGERQKRRRGESAVVGRGVDAGMGAGAGVEPGEWEWEWNDGPTMTGSASASTRTPATPAVDWGPGFVAGDLGVGVGGSGHDLTALMDADFGFDFGFDSDSDSDLGFEFGGARLKLAGSKVPLPFEADADADADADVDASGEHVLRDLFPEVYGVW